MARPTNAKIVSTFDEKPGVVYVTVDYSIERSDRSMKVIVQESGAGAKISGWLDDTLVINLGDQPGSFEINGLYHAGHPGKQDPFVALPGIYTLKYVDPQGFGTVDPKGGATAGFEVEFPVNSGRFAKTHVPSGVVAQASGISAQPRLLATVKRTLQAQLETLIDKCTSSGLVGTTCPPGLVSYAGRGSAVDSGTVVWKRTVLQLSPPKNQWGFFADYSVSFTRVGSPASDTADAIFDMIVVQDAEGKPVLTPAERADS